MWPTMPNSSCHDILGTPPFTYHVNGAAEDPHCLPGTAVTRLETLYWKPVSRK
jgi:hypothetical protein